MSAWCARIDAGADGADGSPGILPFRARVPARPPATAVRGWGCALGGRVWPESPLPSHGDYAALVAGELAVREARPGDARAIAEVSMASRRWSYRELLTEAELEVMSVEETTADFAHGLAELRPGSAVLVAELAGRIVGYAYVLPSPEDDVPAGTSELGSLYVTEDVGGRESLRS